MIELLSDHTCSRWGFWHCGEQRELQGTPQATALSKKLGWRELCSTPPRLEPYISNESWLELQ